ncbi:nuclear transport factor 2 family protein, partial [Nocardia farcinica]|uniref:nuclear transport factor 2 family protein n=1 Tax=Nocardia farcinica TaxID=37329 RepID=UPI0024537DA3
MPSPGDGRYCLGGGVFVGTPPTRADGTATSGIWVRVSYGLRRIDGAWLIAHDQVSVPLD